MALNWFKKKKSESAAEDSDTRKSNQAVEPQAGVEHEDQDQALDRPIDPQSGAELEDRVRASESLNPPDQTEEMDRADPIGDVAPSPSPAVDSKGLFARLKSGLSKTRRILTTDIEDLFSSRSEIDDDFLEELEELLITSDIGVQTAMELMDAIRRKASRISGPNELKDALREDICALLDSVESATPQVAETKPHIIMVVGVNGVGKTTTIGKLAARSTSEGKKVLIVAADTFRAAAIEQLGIWAERADADLVKHRENSDPAAVVFDGIEASLARGSDVVFIDTAGRLHTKVNLMEELKKIKRTIGKKIPEAPHEILLVLDATTGQNAISQAKLFHEAIGVTGLVLTKLDGTAKGGIVVSICQTLSIPLHHIGVGESIEDLQPFDPKQFVQALF